MVAADLHTGLMKKGKFRLIEAPDKESVKKMHDQAQPII
jgi:hypothetical protein